MGKNGNPFSLEGAVSLVTGGARGLGYGIAKGLASAGSDLVLVDRSNEELAEAKGTLSKDTGRRVMAIQADVTRLEDIEETVGKAIDTFGRIDTLVNNAGINVRKPFLEVTPEEFDGVMAVNLRAVFFFGQKTAVHMARRGSGAIINIASLSSKIGFKNISIYGAAKGGVFSLTKGMAVELATSGVRVNAIAPGYFRTKLTEAVFEDPARMEWVISRIPVGRYGMPDDLAGTAVYLASKASEYVTGEVVFVDGGWMSA